MDIVLRVINFFRIVAGLFMVLLGGICYVLLGHLLLPQTWRDKLAMGLYLPLAEACAGKRDWADLFNTHLDSERNHQSFGGQPCRNEFANGAESVEQHAARDANTVQDGVNICGIVGAFHRHLLALSRLGHDTDELINHPISLAFVSKLNSLCRMNLDREMAALGAIGRIEAGEAVEYEVIPL